MTEHLWKRICDRLETTEATPDDAAIGVMLQWLSEGPRFELVTEPAVDAHGNSNGIYWILSWPELGEEDADRDLGELLIRALGWIWEQGHEVAA